MTLMEKILVISDFAESSREYPRCKEVRKILDNGEFDLAMYLCIKYTIEAVLASGNTPLEEQYEINRELLKQSLTDELIAKQFIEKWDGKLPETYAGEDILGIFNLK